MKLPSWFSWYACGLAIANLLLGSILRDEQIIQTGLLFIIVMHLSAKENP